MLCSGLALVLRMGDETVQKGRAWCFLYVGSYGRCQRGIQLCCSIAINLPEPTHTDEHGLQIYLKPRRPLGLASLFSRGPLTPGQP